MNEQSTESMLQEILENSRKTKSYMKWQLIITVAMVVIPFLLVLIVLPMILNSVGSIGVDTAAVLE